MARNSNIKLRRSATFGAIPTTSNLDLGELALNTYDGKLYMKTTESSLDSIVQVGSATDSYHKIRKSLTLEFEVKVQTKTSDHAWHGSGSSNAYSIDGIESPHLHLVPGNTYRFDQSDSSNSGHPLRFYYDAAKTTAYTTGVTTSGTPGSSGAYTQIIPTDNTPMVLHYQCSAHGYMGGRADFGTRNLTGYTTDGITEGSTNQYFTNARARSAISVSGDLSYNSSTGVISFSETTAATTRALISVTDNGGDGSLAYNNSTGVITYNGPNASEVRTHFSGGTGVTISSGEVAIGQAVATNSNVQFANLTLSGDLTVNGTTTTVSSTNSVIADALIELGNGTSGSPSNDAGLVIERGSSDNVFIGWDESADAITFGTGSFTGASTGNLTITPSAVNTGAITITNATNSGGTARNVYQSTSAPTGSDGAVGDLWILYS